MTVGGSEGIDIAMRAMLDPGDEVLIPQPSYVSYVPCTILAGGVPVVIELEEKDQFKLTPEKLLEKITDKTKLLGMKKNDNVLYLDFSKEYNSMEPIREILCRAAFVKTLTQAEGVEFVAISCEGQPKLDSAGNPVGALGKSDFVEYMPQNRS